MIIKYFFKNGLVTVLIVSIILYLSSLWSFTSHDYKLDLAKYNSANFCSSCLSKGFEEKYCIQKACFEYIAVTSGEPVTSNFVTTYCSEKHITDIIINSAKNKNVSFYCEEYLKEKPNYFHYILSKKAIKHAVSFSSYLLNPPVLIIIFIVGGLIGIIIRKIINFVKRKNNTIK